MVPVVRTGLQIAPNRSRVVFRSFFPGSDTRVMKIIARVLSLTEDGVKELLESIFKEFNGRHARIEAFYLKRYEDVKRFALTDLSPSQERKLLIGAFFTNEYSLESAALFNPSMIWHPDQSGLLPGSSRFILSLRATGEGHISSITFRSGIVDAKNEIMLDEDSRWVTMPEVIPDGNYEKRLFEQKLMEMKHFDQLAAEILEDLEENFSFEQLQQSIKNIERRQRNIYSVGKQTIDGMMMLAQSNYEVCYNENDLLSERIIFPHSPTESNGIETLALCSSLMTTTRFATMQPILLMTGALFCRRCWKPKIFITFKMSTLNGPEAQNKGMALFPRRINGNYAMISRQDGENVYIMFSDNLHFWYSKEILLKPTYPWEYVQLGNCGSPIETEAGWLLLTHGVGAMRKYSIGAVLLDKEDPRKVIGRLKEPLLSPDANEREGYVPNVVYSCGAVVHRDTLILPYAMSDYASSIATVPLKDLLAELKKP